MNFAVMDSAVFFKFFKMVESRLFKGAGAGDGAGEKNPETVKKRTGSATLVGIRFNKETQKAINYVKVPVLS